MRPTHCVPVFVLAFAPLLAQVPREPVRGTVLLAADQPWAGAQVQLLSRPVPDEDRVGESDLVRALSDAKGRFLVDLLPGRCYTAWACMLLGDGTYRASHAVDDVRAGGPLELVADAVRPLGSVQIDGLDPWRAGGAIECQLRSRTANVIAAPCVEQDGRFALPPLPGRRAALEVLCGGRPLQPWPEPLDLTVATHTVRIQAPRAVRLRFVDADTSQPIADATIAASMWLRSLLHEIAHSDVTGNAVATLPIGSRAFDWVNYPVMLQARGHAPINLLGRLQVPADHDAAAGKPVATIELHKGLALRSVLALADTACAGAPIRIRNDLQSTTEGTHRIAWWLSTDVQSGFEVDVDPRTPAGLGMLLRPSEYARLAAAAAPFPLHPEALLAVVPANAQAAALPAKLDLAALAPMRVQVSAPDGAPAADAFVGIGAAFDGHVLTLSSAATDRSGRACFLVPREQELLVTAWSDDGWIVHPMPRADALVAPLRIQLQSVRQLPGLVEDAAGRPVPYAQVTYSVIADGGEMGFLTRSFGYHLVRRTDAKGSFSVPLYPGARYSVSSVATPDDDHYVRQPEFTVGKDEPESLHLELTKR